MIEIISKSIDAAKLQTFIGKPFPEMIKFVVDVEKKILALGGELHADAEALLLEAGSDQENLWGGNYYPQRQGEERIAYTSMINIRPSSGNKSIELKDVNLRRLIRDVVVSLLP